MSRSRAELQKELESILGRLEKLAREIRDIDQRLKKERRTAMSRRDQKKIAEIRNKLGSS